MLKKQPKLQKKGKIGYRQNLFARSLKEKVFPFFKKFLFILFFGIRIGGQCLKEMSEQRGMTAYCHSSSILGNPFVRRQRKILLRIT
jgi:hypothetical protein